MPGQMCVCLRVRVSVCVLAAYIIQVNVILFHVALGQPQV